MKNFAGDIFCDACGTYLVNDFIRDGDRDFCHKRCQARWERKQRPKSQPRYGARTWTH